MLVQLFFVIFRYMKTDMEQYTFKFKNITYQLTDHWEDTDSYQFDTLQEAKDFQIMQFRYLIEVSDFVTMENRLRNQIMRGYVKEL